MKTEKYGMRQAITFIGQIASLGCLVFAPISALADYTNFPLVWADVKTWHNISPSSKVIHDSYVDVSQYVDKWGGGNPSDNTTAMQQAINNAHDNNLAVYFPHGTYVVNDTLNLIQESKSNGNNFLGEMTFTHCLVGEAGGARPVVKLADYSGGFNNTSIPKPLFLYRNYDGGTTNEEPGDAYNMVFRGIDINLNAANNAGAVGVDMHAAQGSTIQDVTITATGAFAGIQSLCGSGTIHGNIKVVDGKYGVYIHTTTPEGRYTENSPMPVLVGVTFENQTTRAIQLAGDKVMGPITIVGFNIKTSNANPVFDLNESSNWHRGDKHLSLIDGSIEFTGTAGIAIKNVNRCVHLRNVYFKNTTNMVNNSQGPNLGMTNSGWQRVDDYNFFYALDQSAGKRQMIDGALSDKDFLTFTETVSAPASDLISRHLWNESIFPHIDGNVIVVDPDDGAGDDDSAAIQEAIDDAHNNGTGQAVFLKQGDYNLKTSLILKSDTKLVGVSRNLTRLHCDPSWTESSDTPMIKTPTAAQGGADATCLIAWLALHMPKDEGDNITFLDWTAGRHSMVREVHFMKDNNWSYSGLYDTKRVKISSSGGGRWYSLFGRAAEQQGEDIEHRLFHVETAGYEEPLSIYALTVEYSESAGYQAEIRNSKYVSIYGLKGETDVGASPSEDGAGVYNHTPILGIVDSEHVIVMGEYGRAEMDNGSPRGVIEIDGSNHIEIANAAGSWKHTHDYAIVKNLDTGDKIEKDDTGNDGNGYPCALFLIGNPNPHAYTPASNGGGGSLAGLNTLELAGGIFAEHVGIGADVTAGGSADTWEFVSVGGEEYHIKCSVTGNYMEFNGGNYAACTLETGTGGDNQKWVVTDRGDGTYNLENKGHPGFYLLKTGANLVTGCNATGCDTWPGAQWIITKIDGSLSGLNTLEVAGGIFAEHVAVGADIIAGASADNWDFVSIGAEEYYIKCSVTGNYMEFNGGNYAACTLETGTGGDNQKWVVTDRGDGTYNLENKGHPGFYLLKTGANLVTGCNATGCDTWSGAQWIITKIDGSLSGLNTLEVAGGIFAEHVAVGADIIAGASADNWDFVPVGAEEYYIKCSVTGNYMEFHGGNYTACTLESGQGDDSQVWIATDRGDGTYNLENKGNPGFYLLKAGANLVTGCNTAGCDTWSGAKWIIVPQ